MKCQAPTFEKYLFICENVRDDGRASCGPESVSKKFVDVLKSAVKEKGLQQKIRVSRTGCLDVCALGPNVLVYPSGRLYTQVKEDDLGEIIEKEIH